MNRSLRVLVGMAVGVVLCGLLPAVVVAVALGIIVPNMEPQLRRNLEGAHGFGTLAIAVCVFWVGAAVGAILGVRWESRSRAREVRGAEPQSQAEGAHPQPDHSGPRAVVDEQLLCYLC